MGNVRPHPRYVPREPSLHGHPTPMKKYGLLCTHLGRKFAIKRTVHLLLGDAEALLTRGSVRLVPFPACPAATPANSPAPRGAAPPQLGFAALSLFIHFSEPSDALMGQIQA